MSLKPAPNRLDGRQHTREISPREPVAPRFLQIAISTAADPMPREMWKPAAQPCPATLSIAEFALFCPSGGCYPDTVGVLCEQGAALPTRVNCTLKKRVELGEDAETCCNDLELQFFILRFIDLLQSA